MKALYKIKKYIDGYKIRLLLNLLLNACTAFFSIFSFIMLIPFLQLIFKAEEVVHVKYPFWENYTSMQQYATDLLTFFIAEMIKLNGKLVALASICIVTAFIFFLKNLSRYLALYVLAPIKTGLSSNIRNKLYEKVIFLDTEKIHKEEKSNLVTKLTSDIQEIEFGILFFLEVILREPITIIITFLVMLFISVKLTLFVLIVLPLSGYLIALIGKKLKRTSLEAQQIQGKLQMIIDESINNNEAIKSFQAEHYFIRLFNQLNHQYFKLNTSMLRRRDLSSPLAEFLGIVVVLIVLFFGGSLILKNQSTLKPELFITYIVIFSQIIQPAKVFSNAFYFIQKGMASLERIEAVLAIENKIKNHKNCIPFQQFRERIEIKNMSFAYDNQSTLENIYLNIEKGKKIALVGHSGAGKTTFAKLLMRFYEINNGAILIDNIPIQDIQLADLRKQIAWVSQQALLFDDSIENNILLGETKDAEKFETVCKQAHIHDFVLQLPAQYQTKIGHDGAKLSGGEKQRICIARALYKNASVLILDEATAHLDTKSEQKIKDVLLELPKDITLLVIAHRLSTIQHCDEIVVLENGKIVEQGTHENLLDKKSYYYNLMLSSQL